MTNYELCPANVAASLAAWIDKGRHGGDFLDAVLSNDLAKAVPTADTTNRPLIPEIVQWLYNEAPVGCWGNSDKVQDWAANGGVAQFDSDELDWAPPTLAAGKTLGPI